MKKLLLFIMCLWGTSSMAQELILPENDTSFKSEFKNGWEWAYIERDGFAVGLTNKKTSDDYGKYYTVGIQIVNLTDKPYTFDPSTVFAELLTKYGELATLEVYTSEGYQKKVKSDVKWSQFFNTLDYALYPAWNGGNSGYTYEVTDRIAADTKSTIERNKMKDHLRISEEGYLKKHTIHSGEGIYGYMNIKYKKGESMYINVPINGNDYLFSWNVKK